MSANFMTAVEAADAIRDGVITSEELVQACLDRIDELEPEIGAWAFIDKEIALNQAREADHVRSLGQPLAPLHGVPVGIKDIFDTFDMPTGLGTPIHEGRTPAEDAGAVAALREAGAIILGKTVTTEMAVLHPGKTRNPHNPEHTPGGSSSGSAAAVACSMVPLSIGTQTNGSMIRPAAYCGVYGFKPSFGRISRYRVLEESHHLDTIGVFGRTLDDVALIADVMIRYDARDKDMKPQARPQIQKFMAGDPPGTPKFAFVRTPVWDQADEETREAFRETIDFLNEKEELVDLLDLPSDFDDIHEVQKRIMEADLAKSFEKEYDNHKDQLSDLLVEMIERGQKVTAVQYNKDIARIELWQAELDLMFNEYDAFITPSAPGTAPKGLESTGSPAFCTIWTICGTPALNLPVMQGENGLPLGLQLVGQKDDDARLFRTAKWFLNKLEEE